MLRVPSSVEHLHEALALAEEPAARARIFVDLAEIMLMAGEWQAGIDAIESGLAELGESEDPLALRLLGMGFGASSYDPQRVHRLDAQLPGLLDLAERGGAAARTLNLWLAVHAAVRGGAAEEVATLAARGFDGGRLIADEGPESLMIPQGLCALVFVDRLDDGRRGDRRPPARTPGRAARWWGSRPAPRTTPSCIPGAAISRMRKPTCARRWR